MKRILLLAAVVTTTTMAPAPNAVAAPPSACFDPANMYSALCAGTRFYYPPGYNVDDPGTWHQWPQYSPWPPQCYPGSGCTR
jgi:hypothetical protein